MNILICDDENQILETNVLIVEDLFPTATILRAQDGYNAIEQIAVFKNLDLIISDNNMPIEGEKTIDGISLFQFTRQTGRSIPFILLTGETNPLFEKFSNECKNFKFLSKPCLPDKLKTEILEILGFDKNIINL